MITLENVTYQYPEGGKPALKDVSLTIGQGEIVAIVGHNGSGKSTLAKHLNALLLPSAGDVIVDNMNTKNEADTLSIRQHVGKVFQNPDNQLVTSIVEEDVGFGPENLGVPPKEIRERVDAALKEVNMLSYAKNASHALSGGQKQRVAIAGMLAMQPDVLVLDEATAMLDPSGRDEVLSTVRRLNKELNMTVIMITQYMEEAVDCHRVFVMAGGRLLTSGTPGEVFRQRALLRENGLDVPAMVALGDELRESGMPIEPFVMTAEELSEAICPLL